jgi:hypothetical protein
MSKDMASEYWQLVHQLSLLGWYRAGKVGNGARRHATWRFQAGHTTDAAPGQTVKERYVAAASEMTAMRELLKELRDGANSAPETTAPATLQDLQREDSHSFDSSLLWGAPQASHQGG